MIDVITTFFTALSPAIARSVVGCLEKVLSDVSDGGSTITKFEWLLLAQTVLRVSFYTALVFFGWDAYSGNADALAAGAAGALIDVLIKSIKPKTETKKTEITTL
jgi:hypothetical protein